MPAAKKSAKTKKTSKGISKKRSNTVYGLEHDFILIAGGGFVALVLILMFITR